MWLIGTIVEILQSTTPSRAGIVPNILWAYARQRFSERHGGAAFPGSAEELESILLASQELRRHGYRFRRIRIDGKIRWEFVTTKE